MLQCKLQLTRFLGVWELIKSLVCIGTAWHMGEITFYTRLQKSITKSDTHNTVLLLKFLIHTGFG
jgi:hypothetical protein